MKPLEGITVLDFSQLLAGPSTGLRLADLGAHVIKVEQPSGDICRTMYTSELVMDEDSSLFHVINRDKDGITLNLKSDEGQKRLAKLLKMADVMLINFRPGVAKKLHIDYDSISKINDQIVYGEISGYGNEGPWKNKPGQDLLVQALSGMCMSTGERSQLPTPVGLSVADMLAGQHLVQGVIAGLIGRDKSGKGTLVQVSMLESIIDLQFEGFSTFLNDGHITPQRSAVSNANFYTNAPYGIYQTKDDYITIAIVPIPFLGELIGCKALETYTDAETWSTKRDEIKAILRDHLLTNTTQHWLDILQAHDIWCSNVYTWDDLMECEAFQHLDMIQDIKLQNGEKMKMLRCPITIDGERFLGSKPSPKLGQDNEKYFK
jgi:crotonobetainyl-CoA:carnitine CoA-transferase CaiB-like acyl-CoA transferase